MSENEPEKPKKGWGCLGVGAILAVLVLLALCSIPMYGLTTVKALQMKGSSNARQIIGLLLTYASDHDGHYPDFGKDLSKLTSNDAFRELVRTMAADGLILDETIFSCPQSTFIGDKKLGSAPDFNEALMPGENHWMMIAGLANDSASDSILVMENAFEVAWPPRWLPYTEPSKSFQSWFSGHNLPATRGRSWKGNTIIIGRNDASVETIKLEEKNSLLHIPEQHLRFTDAHVSGIKILDIEVETPGTSSTP